MNHGPGCDVDCSKCLYGGKPGEDGCVLEHGAPHTRAGRKRWKGKQNPIRVALIGNANVGKSALFNQMTGMDQRTGNWAGKTVELARGKVFHKGRLFEIIDLPGIYSLSSYTEEEIVTRDFLASGEVDVVVNVVDATALERNLYLTTQILEMGLPMVVALNQADLAKKKGIKIKKFKLMTQLGVPVDETVGITGQGLKKVMNHCLALAGIKEHHYDGKVRDGKPHDHHGSDHWLHQAHHLENRYVKYGPEVERRVKKLQKKIARPIQNYAPRFLAAKLLEGDEVAATLVASRKPKVLATANKLRDELSDIHGEEAATVMTQERYSVSTKIAQAVTSVKHGGGETFRDKLDRATTHPVLGYIILIAVVMGSFFLIFSLGDIVSERFMLAYDWLGGYVQDAIGDGWLYLILWEGAVQGFVAAIAFVLPYILPFYILLAILEDSGYLARVAILLDALMHRFGLHGKAFIPMILGYGCSVPAVLGTRILETRRERFIAAFMAGFVPCAARTTVIMALVGAFLGWYWALSLYVFNILVIALLGLVAARVLPGKAYGLIMEVPPYRTPAPVVVAKQTWLRLKDFVIVALPVIVIGSVVLVLLEGFNVTDAINWVLSPVTVYALGLPSAVGIILLLGILRKELTVVMLVALWGSAVFYPDFMTYQQLLVFTLFVMFYIPCISTIAALFKEFGIRATFVISMTQFVVALVIAGLCNITFYFMGMI